ncbi:MAG: hypothetical protein BWX88_04706 [Planctomycetes bacterium ADurb.Bin126]|nr:MAG: hypothetical protein BWX88_04706 [Planctomycetes bacterium ADurb.Bin126]HOD81714.1 hypothetical protein [Phycisphaerae bacterium]HQL76516.1 hypothetical protein [Phycisphaerae bacterium]
MKANATTGSLKERVLAELCRDKKKAALLGGLALVALFMVAKTLLSQPAPQKAKAANSLLTKPQPLSAGAARAAAAQKAQPAARSGRKSQGKSALLSGDLPSEIKRDLFLLNPTYFPPDKAVKPTTTQPAAPTRQAPARDKIVQAQAGGLLLESVIMSSRPVAIVNGQMRQVGQRIGDFDIVEIAATSCIVCKDGILVQLNMRDQTPKVVGVEPEGWLFEKPYGSAWDQD